MISIVKKKNKIKRELLSKIEWACSLNAIKLEYEMIFEGCLRIIEHTNLEIINVSVIVIRTPIIHLNPDGSAKSKYFFFISSFTVIFVIYQTTKLCHI